MVADGIDPLEAKKGVIEARKAAAPKPSFGECVDALIWTKGSAWRSAKHGRQWRQTLIDHAGSL